VADPGFARGQTMASARRAIGLNGGLGWSPLQGPGKTPWWGEVRAQWAKPPEAGSILYIFIQKVAKS